MTDAPKKRVDESWKEQVEHEKQQPAVEQPPAVAKNPAIPAAPEAPSASPKIERPDGQEEGLPEARFDLFISGLAMDALIALGDVPHPVTHRQAANLEHAKYLIDMIGVIEEKTRGNLTPDEDRLLKDALYQLRMRYMAKAGQ